MIRRLDDLQEGWYRPNRQFQRTSNSRYHLFSLETRRDGTLYWDFLVPESPRWDAVHQGLFRNFRGDEIVPDTLPAGTPEVPPIPPGPYPGPEAYLLPPFPIPESQHPHVRDAIRSNGDRPIVAYAVLVEDLYETTYGDGLFRYLRKTFADESAARTYMDQRAREMISYEMRKIAICIEDSCFSFPDFQIERCDHHHAADVLAQLDEVIRESSAN